MPDILEQAIKSLAIQEVRLRNTNINFADEIAPLDIKNKKLEVQVIHGVEKIQTHHLQEGESDWLEYNFFYKAGVRLVDVDSKETPLIEIQAVFNALYRTEKQLEKAALEAFSENHVGYHVWPYWREYVQSTCMRLGIKPIRVPLYRVKTK
ncbi:hypothetical protein [Marinospirillum insulare]|uniref:Preprotein translocase subunit SecB n=1 Tax=Marinospirillum insulare TaxID=217169 RepID=A0ABQ5ZZ55_9GAMM|nr:hypothetical protein [Marinospirillum insulare]GLR64667.1 hypothetical protein GCM10007878_21050 [Marinospirillum insulare]